MVICCAVSRKGIDRLRSFGEKLSQQRPARFAGAKVSANRNTVAVKAALNLAVKARMVSIEKARE
jgi:hypothetical protein